MSVPDHAGAVLDDQVAGRYWLVGSKSWSGSMYRLVALAASGPASREGSSLTGWIVAAGLVFVLGLTMQWVPAMLLAPMIAIVGFRRRTPKRYRERVPLHGRERAVVRELARMLARKTSRTRPVRLELQSEAADPSEAVVWMRLTTRVLDQIGLEICAFHQTSAPGPRLTYGARTPTALVTEESYVERRYVEGFVVRFSAPDGEVPALEIDAAEVSRGGLELRRAEARGDAMEIELSTKALLRLQHGENLSPEPIADESLPSPRVVAAVVADLIDVASARV